MLEHAQSPQPSRSLDVEAGTVQEFVGEGSARTRAHPVLRVRATVYVLRARGWSGGHEHADYFDIWNGEDLVIGFAPNTIPTSGGPVAWDSLMPNGNGLC
ncbi:MAG: hypothetical protein WB297_02480 [Actinomycetota bacterium]